MQNISYHIDPSTFSLGRFKQSIISRNLIPSRRILKEMIDERFSLLKSMRIHSLQDIIQALNTKAKMAAFSTKSSLPLDYLIVLNREAKSFFPNPIPLKKFTHIPVKIIDCLAINGIKNTKQMFDLTYSPKKDSVIDSCKIEKVVFDELMALSDLGRGYGIGPVFAKMLFDLGIDSLSSFAQHTPKEIIALYEEANHKKADFTIEDIQFSQNLVKILNS